MKKTLNKNYNTVAEIVDAARNAEATCDIIELSKVFSESSISVDNFIKFLCKHDPANALYLTGKNVIILSPKQIDACASVCYVAALSYVASLLTKKRLDKCAKKAPYFAREYAKKFITKKRLDWCNKQLSEWDAKG